MTAPQRSWRPRTPEKGTPEYELWILAIDIAIAVPERHGAYVGNAGIPWEYIHELRKTLDALGIDWLKAKKEDDARRARRSRGGEGHAT